MSIITIVLCLLALLLVDIEAMHSDSDPPQTPPLKHFVDKNAMNISPLVYRF